VQPIIEGQMSKGGQNSVNLNKSRPPAPQGSGGQVQTTNQSQSSDKK
jgi:hypothetical protein